MKPYDREEARRRREALRAVGIREGLIHPRTAEDIGTIASSPQRVRAIEDALQKQANLVKNYRSGVVPTVFLAESIVNLWTSVLEEIDFSR